jgi:dephospho-CoA kinase
MKTVIVTGGIGSGKSYISKMLKAMYGIPVFDTDTYGKYAMTYDLIIKDKITKIIGKESYNNNGSLNRDFISSVIFNDDGTRKWLENLIKEKVHEYFDEFKKEYENNLYCIYECANINANLKDLPAHEIDYILCVFADKTIRTMRVISRNKWSNEKVEKIMSVQHSDDFYLSIASDIILNNGNNIEDDIKHQHSRILSKLGLTFTYVHERMIAEDCRLFPYGHCEKPKCCYPCEFQFQRSEIPIIF